jgi:anti-anti-sigma regulatory factor
VDLSTVTFMDGSGFYALTAIVAAPGDQDV